MTYCLGVLLQDGLVMLADTRTNAGVDNISTFKKLHVFETPGERAMAIASAGNLSVTQSMLAILNEGMVNPETGEVETPLHTQTMFRTAQLIARALAKAYGDLNPGLAKEGVPGGVTLLFGGQIKDGPMSLYQIYEAGNFIECGPDAPFLQAGETKYGKPVLDWALHYDTDLMEGLKIGLISMEGTMRSNLAVGMPLDLLVSRSNTQAFELNYRIEPDDAYFAKLGETWRASLDKAHRAIPLPPYRAELAKTGRSRKAAARNTKP